MKTMNLRGITKSMSDNEMKQVKGGLYGYESKVPLDGKEYDNGGGGSCSWFKCWCKSPSPTSPILPGTAVYPIVQASNAIVAVNFVYNASNWGCWNFNEVGCAYDKPC